jgi:hypothetical protein
VTTFFDFLTVALFAVMSIAFFLLTDRNSSTLVRLLLCGVAFAFANQIGNAGWIIVASILIIAGSGYAAFVLAKSAAWRSL